MARRTRDPLSKSLVGKEQCTTWQSPNGDLKICIRGSKYGFNAELIGKTGQRLPVSTGNARTMREAITNAKAVLDRVATKYN